jgi:hypothetical protein
MHIEVLTEDSSGKVLLEHLLPKLIGRNSEPHSWRVTAYRGIGRIPPGMKGGDPAKRILLDQLPRVLGGYAKTPGIDAVVVVLDADDRDCVAFLAELRDLAASRRTPPTRKPERPFSSVTDRIRSAARGRCSPTRSTRADWLPCANPEAPDPAT